MTLIFKGFVAYQWGLINLYFFIFRCGNSWGNLVGLCHKVVNKWGSVVYRFRGQSELSLDDKGRVAVPARFREVLSEGCEGQLVVTIHEEDQCLLLYPLPVWEKIEKDIDDLPGLHPRVRKLQRTLVGHAEDLSMDKAGRILIPANLRSIAGLDKKAILVGQGKKFELWSEEAWQAMMKRAEAMDDSDAINLALSQLSL
jgi:MraZ protein